MPVDGTSPNPLAEPTQTSSSALETMDLGNWPDLAKHFFEKFFVRGQRSNLEATQLAPQAAITDEVGLASKAALNVPPRVYRGRRVDVSHTGELDSQILTPHDDPHPQARPGRALCLWCETVVLATASEHGGGGPWQPTR